MDENNAPVYKSRETVLALKISGMAPTTSKWGFPWTLSFEDVGQPSVEVSHQFMQGFQPEPGGYYVIKQGMTAVCMRAEEFERLYQKDE